MNVSKVQAIEKKFGAKFIKPSELNSMLTNAQFKLETIRGISYSVSEDEFQLATKPVVNYAVSALRC